MIMLHLKYSWTPTMLDIAWFQLYLPYQVIRRKHWSEINTKIENQNGLQFLRQKSWIKIYKRINVRLSIIYLHKVFSANVFHVLSGSHVLRKVVTLRSIDGMFKMVYLGKCFWFVCNVVIFHYTGPNTTAWPKAWRYLCLK